MSRLQGAIAFGLLAFAIQLAMSLLWRKLAAPRLSRTAAEIGSDAMGATGMIVVFLVGVALGGFKLWLIVPVTIGVALGFLAAVWTKRKSGFYDRPDSRAAKSPPDR